MKEVINISTGEVKVGSINNILVSNGIGSCIVVAAINLKKNIGGIAHIMLPGKAPLNESQNNLKYTENAIDKLLQILKIQHDDTSAMSVCLIGGGNVLKKPDDKICESNILSISNLLKELRIKISATALGGCMRRSVHFNIETREVHFTEGDSELTLLNRWC